MKLQQKEGLTVDVLVRRLHEVHDAGDVGRCVGNVGVIEIRRVRHGVHGHVLVSGLKLGFGEAF